MAGPLEQTIREKVSTTSLGRFTHSHKQADIASLHHPWCIRQLQLTASLNPTSLTISNDSAAHRHHAPMKAQGGGNGETHFTVQVVSDKFEGVVSPLPPAVSRALALPAKSPASQAGHAEELADHISRGACSGSSPGIGWSTTR